ncbi:GNAT family N-acetyltransferase [Virgibacillus flavescens]|uniref:GNAT family N-acetyltransferase n=1 Tax=Virgibacillus flavescens TaxID=1611422 RepID=UPI003D33D8BB
MIRTERLQLRRMNTSDVDLLMEIFSDPVAMKHYPSTKNREETLQWIEWNRNNYQEYGVGLWIVEDKQTNKFLGQCGIVPQKFDKAVKMEIGYLFKQEVWGNGYATEAAFACKQYGFEEKKFPMLISLIDLENLPSIRVAERIGMKLESTVHRWEKEVLLYSCFKQTEQGE